MIQFELNNNNISKLIKYTNFENIKNEEEKKTPINKLEAIKQDDFFTVPYKNKLLWFLYIIEKGMGAYQQINSNYYTVEQDEKFSYIDLLRNHKTIIKSNKKWKLKNLENDITFSNCFSLSTLECLTSILNINLYYIDGCKIYTSLSPSSIKDLIVHKINNEYKLELFYNHDEMYKTTLEYRNTLWNIENIEKPLSKITNYKLQQLIDIANKLNINIMASPTKKKTKKQLYDEITKKI